MILCFFYKCTFHLITYTRAVDVTVSVFCLLTGLCKTSLPVFAKFGGTVAHAPGKIPFDFGRNLEHVALGLCLGEVRIMIDVPHQARTVR